MISSRPLIGPFVPPLALYVSVKTALSTQLTRESQWTRKSSTAVQCQEILQSVSEECFIPTEENTYVLDTALQIVLPKVKKAAKAKILL